MPRAKLSLSSSVSTFDNKGTHASRLGAIEQLGRHTPSFSQILRVEEKNALMTAPAPKFFGTRFMARARSSTSKHL